MTGKMEWLREIGSDDLERFWGKVAPDPNSGCWLWCGHVGRRGYGYFSVHSHPVTAHRFSYVAFRGEIGERMNVLHKCDVRSCVNPDHLWLGTLTENNRDMVKKKRHRFFGFQSGERHRQAKLTEAAVRDILSSPLAAWELGEIYGVRPEQVRLIRNGLAWRHVSRGNVET